MKKLIFLISLLFALPVAAEDKPALPILTVYTYDSFVSEWGPGAAVKVAFEKICHCQLKLIGVGDGAAMLTRLRLEGERTEADIALGLDSNLIAQAQASGLFIPHASVVAPLDIPYDWHDDIFIPYDWGYFAFIYDKTKLVVPPDSFEALIAMPDDFKIIIQDPRSSTPGLGLLLWVQSLYGDGARDIWAGLASKILTVTKGWSEAYGLFTQGEADMVLSYTTSPAYHIIAENDETKAAAAFHDGHYMQIEVAGMISGTDQLRLANKFLTFIHSIEFQSIIPTTNWMYPVIMPQGGLPAGFEKLIVPQKSLLIPPAQVVEIRQKALKEWLIGLR